MQTVETSTSNVYIWDPLHILCPTESCSQFSNGKPIFRDNNHLSDYGSRYLADYFIDFLSSHNLILPN